MRDEDSVFRQGGDEFAVIVPEANTEEAEEVAARLRARVRGCGSGRFTRSSASTGIAMFPADGRTADQLSRVADLALLGAKQTGGRSDRDHTIDVAREGGPLPTPPTRSTAAAPPDGVLTNAGLMACQTTRV